MGLTNNLGKLSSIITSTGSAVGIGTASPADLLEVKGGNIRLSALAGVGPQFNLYSNGQTSNHVTLAQGFALSTDNIGYLYNRANADFVFGTNNAERMRISAAGYVGIGTSSPAALLDVSGGGYGTSIRITTSSVNGADLTLNNTGTGGKRWDIVSGGSNNAIGAGGLQFYNQNDDVMRMGITSGGNVLINATSTGPYFDGIFNAYASGTAPAACFKNDGTGGQITTSFWNALGSGDNIFMDFVTEASFTRRGRIF